MHKLKNTVRIKIVGTLWLLTWLICSCSTKATAPGTAIAQSQPSKLEIRQNQFLWNSTRANRPADLPRANKNVLRTVRNFSKSAKFTEIELGDSLFVVGAIQPHTNRGHLTVPAKLLHHPVVYGYDNKIARSSNLFRAPKLEAYDISHDGHLFAGLTSGNSLFLFDRSGKPITNEFKHSSDIRAKAFSPNRDLLAFVQSNFLSRDKIYFLDTLNWLVRKQFETDIEVADLKFSDDGENLIAVSDTGKLRVYDRYSDEPVRSINTNIAARKLIKTLNSDIVGIASEDSLSLYDFVKKAVISEVKFGETVERVRLSNNDEIVMTSDGSRFIKFWNVRNNKLILNQDTGMKVAAFDVSKIKDIFGVVSRSGDGKLYDLPLPNNLRDYVESNVDKSWETFYDREYNPNTPIDQMQKIANELLDQEVANYLGEPKIGDIKYDNIKNRYVFDIESSNPVAWKFKQSVYIDSEHVDGLTFSETSLRDYIPRIIFEIKPSGFIQWDKAFLSKGAVDIPVKLLDPFTPLPINPQLAGIFSGLTPTETLIAEAQNNFNTGNALALGDYHALIIGNNDYESYPDLNTAVTDANVLTDLLSNDYGFQVSRLINATRADVLKTLDDYRRKLNQDDNLLVYYAGHGIYDEDTERGYWLPVDATESSSYDWISNADLTDRLKAIKAKHVMVIADSCYSGTLTRGLKLPSQDDAYWKRIAKKKSRTVLTSGGLEPVLDSGGGNHSVFANALIKALEANMSLIDGTTLFENVRKSVIRQAEQTPQYSDIRFAGHAGGDFILQRVSK